MEANLFDFTVKNANGTELPLSDFKGKVSLIVNVASKCGFTSQYNGLEKLNREYKEKGLAVIGFPCNQFGHQEPGSDSEIQQFCQMNYGVSFPVLAKIEVNGDAESPLFTWLKKSAPGMLGTEAIKWNFTKFLVDRKGNVLGRYAPQTKPEDIKKDIERALANV